MPQQPHVIYILSDEHFGGAMGHMGDANVRTPNMDRMAAEGVSFERRNKVAVAEAAAGSPPF